jgi:site-specific recombinase XerD
MVLHGLRHAFASQLAARGVSLHTISGLLGHQSVTTTMRYAHFQDGALRQATQQLADQLV